MKIEKFKFGKFFLLMRIFLYLSPIIFIGIYAERIFFSEFDYFLTGKGKLVMLGLMVSTIFGIIKTISTFNFSIEFSDMGITLIEGLNKNQIHIQWEELNSVTVNPEKNILYELKSKDSKSIKIPVGIEKSFYIRSKIEKMFPNITTKK